MPELIDFLFCETKFPLDVELAFTTSCTLNFGGGYSRVFELAAFWILLLKVEGGILFVTCQF